MKLTQTITLEHEAHQVFLKVYNRAHAKNHDRIAAKGPHIEDLEESSSSIIKMLSAKPAKVTSKNPILHCLRLAIERIEYRLNRVHESHRDEIRTMLQAPLKNLWETLNSIERPD